jgi:hypothetical protein
MLNPRIRHSPQKIPSSSRNLCSRTVILQYVNLFVYILKVAKKRNNNFIFLSISWLWVIFLFKIYIYVFLRAHKAICTREKNTHKDPPTRRKPLNPINPSAQHPFKSVRSLLRKTSQPSKAVFENLIEIPEIHKASSAKNQFTIRLARKPKPNQIQKINKRRWNDVKFKARKKKFSWDQPTIYFSSGSR